MQKLFEKDLAHLLDTLEKLWQGKCDHVEYIKAYRYFVETWCPKKKKVIGENEITH